MLPLHTGDDAREAAALLEGSDPAGRRRRSSPVQSASPSPPGWDGGLRRQSSFFRQDVAHAASETYLVTRLTFSLLRYLG
jgi:prenylcysteine alpha-carboxyl methylesterase